MNIQNSSYSSSNPILYFGSYTGDGSASRTISLSTSVRCVLVAQRGYFFATIYGYYGGIVNTSNRTITTISTNNVLSLNSNNTSITVYYNDDSKIYLNDSSELYIWIAWK